MENILAAWVLVGGMELCLGVYAAQFYEKKYCRELRLLGLGTMVIATGTAVTMKLIFPTMM